MLQRTEAASPWVILQVTSIPGLGQAGARRMELQFFSGRTWIREPNNLRHHLWSPRVHIGRRLEGPITPVREGDLFTARLNTIWSTCNIYELKAHFF